MKDYIKALRNIFNYKDEATIKEFWNFFILNLIFDVVMRRVHNHLDLPTSIYYIYLGITGLALIAVGFRRVKNAGYSGWLFFIPIINLFFAILPERKIKMNCQKNL